MDPDCDWRRVSWMPRLGVAVVASVLVWVSVSADEAASWPPARLADTGLYSDWARRTIAPENLPYSPQYPLWTDGAKKSRWLFIPKGTSVDASNPDAWQFPVGTRAWKEFRFGRRAETRFIEHTPDGWRYATYAWNEDESDAVLAPENGIRYSVEIRDGVRHGIPSRADCRACHEAGPTRLLGLNALQLSPDRDPNAPHAEQLSPDAVDLRVLVDRGLVRGLPSHLVEHPPRIAAESATARAALGYLHGNCGHCHTSAGELGSLSFALNYEVGPQAVEAAHALFTAVDRPSKFRLATAPDSVNLICRGEPDKSVLVARMSSRNPVLQMPPLGTRLVDDEAVSLVRRWIAEQQAPARSTTETREVRR